MEHSFIAPALIGLLLMVSMTLFAQIRIERSRHRQSELERVKDLLSRHYDSLDRVHAAEALPQDMKEVAAWVSSAIEDEATAVFFVERLLDLHGDQASRPAESVEIKVLRSTHPELMDEYDLAMSSGILAFLLKWPQTAPQAVRIMDEFFISRHGETAAAVRVAKERRQSPGQPALSGAF